MTLKVHMNQFFQVGVLLTLALVLCAPMTSQAAIEKGAEKNKEYHWVFIGIWWGCWPSRWLSA